jgi:hypothetical protein
VTGSNRRPSACKADALPAELTALAQNTVDESQASARLRECRERYTPSVMRTNDARWISVTDEQGVPGLELVGATTCTAAVDTSDLCASQRSPYPGWVQVTDEIGRDPADAGGSGRACRDVPGVGERRARRRPDPRPRRTPARKITIVDQAGLAARAGKP